MQNIQLYQSFSLLDDEFIPLAQCHDTPKEAGRLQQPERGLDMSQGARGINQITQSKNNSGIALVLWITVKWFDP